MLITGGSTAAGIAKGAKSANMTKEDQNVKNAKGALYANMTK